MTYQFKSFHVSLPPFTAFVTSSRCNKRVKSLLYTQKSLTYALKRDPGVYTQKSHTYITAFVTPRKRWQTDKEPFLCILKKTYEHAKEPYKRTDNTQINLNKTDNTQIKQTIHK